MFTAMLLVIVTDADATTEVPPFCEDDVAWIVMGFVEGTAPGAVYRAVFAVALTIVPIVAFPPTIPFASHVMLAAEEAQNEAVNTCVWLNTTLADGGEIEFAAEQVIVTLAVPNFELSATLVAVTVTVGGDGGSAGAVYRAEIGPFETIVPAVEFPPAMPLTLQITPGAELPVPVIVAVNTWPPLVGKLAEEGDSVTTMSSLRLTVTDALASVFAWLTAEIVTLGGDGKIPGAV
jgi:hypothetical protein